MNCKSLDFVGLTSEIMPGPSVLGLVVLAVGPWAQPSTDAARTALRELPEAFVANSVGNRFVM